MDNVPTPRAAADDEWPWPHFPKGARRNSHTIDRTKGERLTGWEGDFLDAYRNTGIISVACEAARVSIGVIQRRRRDDEQFREALEDARELAADALEAAAWNRAVIGLTKTKRYYKGGQLVAEEQTVEVSDRLLIKLLEAARPEKFRDGTDRTHEVAILREEVRKMAIEQGLDAERAVAEAERIYAETHGARVRAR